VFAAQIGWQQVKPGESTETRLEMFGDQTPAMPATERVIDAWLDAGCCGRNGDGSQAPFSWMEFQAFAAVSGTDLEPHERMAVVEMSRAYCSGLYDTRPLSLAPVRRETYD